MKMNLVKHVVPGAYPGAFDGVQETSHEEYGRGIRWIFRIDQGDHAGSLVSRTTKDEASVNNACGKFWKMISGLPLDDAITHDTDEWIGDGGMIVVEDSPSGEGVRVAQFIRDPKQARAVGDSPF